MKPSFRVAAKGAEFLVLGTMLVEGIEATPAYAGFPGYDILAYNPDRRLQCRVQVKSRWATDFDRTFTLKKDAACDFVVFVALNRGYAFKKKKTSRGADDGRCSPEFYVFPTRVVTQLVVGSVHWATKVPIDKVKGLDGYRDKWDLIKKYLGYELIGPSQAHAA